MALICIECGDTSEDGEGWKAELAVVFEDEEEPGEVAVYCPQCSEREFGSRWEAFRPPPTPAAVAKAIEQSLATVLTVDGPDRSVVRRQRVRAAALVFVLAVPPKRESRPKAALRLSKSLSGIDYLHSTLGLSNVTVVSPFALTVMWLTW